MSRWNDLTMAQKSELIGMAVRNGITGLEDIRNIYDDGGEIKKYYIDNVNPVYTDQSTGEVWQEGKPRGTIVLPEVEVKGQSLKAKEALQEDIRKNPWKAEKPLQSVYPEFEMLSALQGFGLGSRAFDKAATQAMETKIGNKLWNTIAYENPNSLLNRNIRTEIANIKPPFGYDIVDPRNYYPFLKGTAETLIGRQAKLRPLEEVVARDAIEHTDAFARNSNIAFRKYLGLPSDEPLMGLRSENLLSSYIPNGKGSYYVNFTPKEELDLLDNFITNKGKGLYDTALGSHGGMGAKIEGDYLKFKDVYDLQPFNSSRYMPKFMRDFEVSNLIPGAKPFTLEGSIDISDYYIPEVYKELLNRGIGGIGPKVTEATGAAYNSLSGAQKITLGAAAGFPFASYYGVKKLDEYNAKKATYRRKPENKD